MSSLHSRPQYICSHCIQHFLGRPWPRYEVQISPQWRRHSSATSSETTPRLKKHFTDPKSRADRGRRVTAAALKYDANAVSRAKLRKVPTHAEWSVPIPPQGGPFPRGSQPNAPMKTLVTTPQPTTRDISTLHVNDAESTTSPPFPLMWKRDTRRGYTTTNQVSPEELNWYWETLPPTLAHRIQARNFFTKDALPKFLLSVASFRTFPESDLPEVALVGRSNVGKSSLLNAIVNADAKALLARTSSTRGFTKTMNLYGVGPRTGVHITKSATGHDLIAGPGGLTIVDMPGYGEGSLAEWGVEIMKYLRERKNLRRVFVLIDAQHGLKDKDRSLLASLRLSGTPHQVILSKVDKVYLPRAKSVRRYNGKSEAWMKKKRSLKELRLLMTAIRDEIQPPRGVGALGELLACSSEVVVDGTRLGIDAVRYAILQAAGLAFSRKGPSADHQGLVRSIETKERSGSREDTVPLVRNIR